VTEIKPIGKIKIVGKRGTEQPFPISGQKGSYLYVLENQAKRLEQINDAYKSAGRRRVEPLESVKIVGRGGIAGYRSFLLGGYEGRYVCVLADHLRRLMEINEVCKELARKKKRPKRAKGKRTQQIQAMA